MIRRPPRSTPLYSSAASDVYKRQLRGCIVRAADNSWTSGYGFPLAVCEYGMAGSAIFLSLSHRSSLAPDRFTSYSLRQIHGRVTSRVRLTIYGHGMAGWAVFLSLTRRSNLAPGRFTSYSVRQIHGRVTSRVRLTVYGYGMAGSAVFLSLTRRSNLAPGRFSSYSVRQIHGRGTNRGRLRPCTLI